VPDVSGTAGPTIEDLSSKVVILDTRINNGFGEGGGVVAAAAVFEHDGHGDFGIFAGEEANEQGVTHVTLYGFFPRENPKIAMAIMLEYGGSGHDAAALSKTVIDACIKYDYLR